MLTSKDIACVVVLYNPDETIAMNIRSYSNAVGRLVLVDNSSVDNSAMFEGMDYFTLMENTGIAHALDVGIAHLSEEYIITMDQDSLLTSYVVDAYLKFLNDHDCGDTGALTCQYETDRHHAGKKSGYEDVKLSMQSGTLFKRDVLERTGFFDENLFLEVVDLEYFLRMEQMGYRLVRVNEALLVHHPAETHEKLGIKYGVASPLRYYYQARNLLWTARKYHSAELYRRLLIKWAKILLLFDDKKEYLRMFRQGIRDAKKGRLGKYVQDPDRNSDL